MKKLTFLFALLCVSIVGWGTDYCHTEINSTNSNGSVLMTCGPTGVANEYQILFEGTNSNPLLAINACSVGINDINNTPGGSTLTFSFDATGNGSAVATFTCASTPNAPYVAYIVFKKSDNSELMLNEFPKDMNWEFVCGGAPAKPDPELSLNATTKTLEIDASVETFQIVANKASGSGNVSYATSDGNIATVSNTGLVTAVGNGTATITVSVAENDDFAADSKTLTVEVIDWPSISWLANSGDSYKLHISPSISDTYGGKRIDGGTSLWVGCPSDLFGACSIEFSHVGAGASFSLSNFTKTRNQFTLVCQGTTYTFTVYRKFDGVNLAKGKPSYSGHAGLPNFEANDGNRGSRWGSEGAKHYADVGDVAEDWWYVDLGAIYSVETIKILFQTACPNDFDILTSPNGDSWVVRGTYGTPAHSGDATTDDNYNEYTFSPAQNARYVKIFARDGLNHLQWGFSMWEFEVYGGPVENVDVNAPVLASASLNGVPTMSEVQIAVSATDTEGAVTTYRVKDSGNGIDRSCTVAAGIITISGLSEGTNYNFTVTALDGIGNQSNAIVVAASTVADPTFPQVAAPIPDGTGKEVLAIYSDVAAFANILAHSFDKDGWEGAHVLKEKDFSGNKCLIYDMSSTKYTTWGMYDNGGNAIIAASGYSDPDNAEHKGVDASGMEKLHIDIWSLQACNSINVQINDQGRGGLHLSHKGEGWQSFDIDLSEFVAAEDVNKRTNNVRWLKFTDFTAVTGKIAIDNVYFWKPESGSKVVSVSVNNGSMGSATAKVGDDPAPAMVAIDTEVTFTATPSSAAYDFAYWQIGETKVYENPYTITITANTNAIATFESHRTAYCTTPITDPTWNTTLYVTITSPSTNNYKILLEGSADYKIESAYNNFNFALTHVNGETGTTTFPAASWTVDNTGYGSAYITFTAADFRAITFDNAGSKYVVFNKQGGGTMEFRAFPDANLIKWDATCVDDEAPVLANPTATPLSGTSVRLTLSATDNMAALLTYYINYDGLANPIEVQGVAGEMTYANLKGLMTGTKYTFSITVSDGTNTSEAKTCQATPTMPTAPVPTHNASLVRSVYSDKYETALKHDFNKNTWVNPTFYTEQVVAGDHFLVYTSDDPTAMPQIAWGVDNDGDEALIAKDEYNAGGENKGLDVRGMSYLHFDMWSAVATVLPNVTEVTLNNARIDFFSLNGSGWQSFDIPLSSMTDDQKMNVRFIKFQGLRDPNPREIAIDNVYFWSPGVTTSAEMNGKTETGGWATFASAAKVKVPEGVTVYTAEYRKTATEEILNLTTTDSRVIPANTGVLIRGAAGTTYAFSVTSDDAPDMSENVLVDCPVRTDISDLHDTYDVFCLRYSEMYEMTGFFLYTGQYIPAGKAYLKLPKQTSGPNSAPRKVRFVFNEEQVATGVENVGADAAEVTKFVENGQLYIRRGDAVYTLQGVRVQ